jgi:hypothetical protein
MAKTKGPGRGYNRRVPVNVTIRCTLCGQIIVHEMAHYINQGRWQHPANRWGNPDCPRPEPEEFEID